MTAFAYTLTGQLASLTDAESQVTSYAYDDAGNKLSETYPDHVTNSTIGQSTYGKILFTYDAVGRTLVRTDQQGDTCTYDYDTAGRKLTESLTISGQTYTVTSDYDAAGQVSGYTYPNGDDLVRTYSDRGQLATIGYESSTIDTRTYDDGGRMTGSSYGNGVSESRSYNTDNTLAGITFTGASISNLTYGWDENKNKTSESISGTMSGYGFTVPTNGYDTEDRLGACGQCAGSVVGPIAGG